MRKDIEAVLLTGGASRRMGTDKSQIPVEGEALGARIARLLAETGIRVTVCGADPIENHLFLPDTEPLAGPLSALANFRPTAPLVFVASCDLAGFDPRVVGILGDAIGDHEAAIPVREGRPQPLCGLYRSSAFEHATMLATRGDRRVMAWLDELDHVLVSDVPEVWTHNVNTPEDLERHL